MGWEVIEVGSGNAEVGPVVVPNEPDYAAAKDAECGKKEDAGEA